MPVFRSAAITWAMSAACGPAAIRSCNSCRLFSGADPRPIRARAALFSGADAAIIADAFRKALRKPDFAGRPVEEGESPDNGLGPGTGELISQELAEEGRDIRSVSSSRGVRVETLSDEDATVHDNPH